MSARMILLLGIDGCRLSITAEDGIAPHLSRLQAAGRLHGMTMVPPTMSGPGWASILTGSTHEQHGVGGNDFIGHRLYSRPDLLSRAFYADQSTTTFAAAGWPPLIDPNGLGPVIHQRLEQQWAGQHRIIARDGETHGYVRVDAEIADYAAAMLAGAQAADVSFVYFCDVDETGHLYGLMGEEYRQAISRVDAHLGRIAAAIEQRAAEHGEDWLVVIVTDHGHVDAGGHGGDTPEECASFVITWSPGGQDRLPDWPDAIAPHELCELILATRT
ncbi:MULTISPECIES: alkaline phosphatase family protein [Brevibacterium]|nr:MULTISPECIES: alkaline phosphatase family protein [Brevibacterium]MCT1656594.1 alkaline phosphatase family protein [Brevibacterium luteolum]MCT1873061.1 alkaline phosphatase family protein [Brevibacterium luteolum]MCT1890449.1 alkaline phosphatase family protein [Brevibacterium luteolum]MCT1892003.1 alkaline phosphatase family protein [Brevibacterium luteolum]MCT1923719.1 alkaline phosphatase family protein [Brevibacterium luteolum]